MSEAVIAGYVRSPFTPARKGALAKVRPDELMAQVVRGLLERNRIDLVELESDVLQHQFFANRGARHDVYYCYFSHGKTPRSGLYKRPI